MTLTVTDLSAIKKIVKRSERRIIKKMDEMDKYLDHGHMTLVKRVDRIESHLGLASIAN